MQSSRLAHLGSLFGTISVEHHQLSEPFGGAKACCERCGRVAVVNGAFEVLGARAEGDSLRLLFVDLDLQETSRG